MALNRKSKRQSAADLALATMEMMEESLNRGCYDIVDVQRVYECWNVTTSRNDYYPAVVNAVKRWVELAQESRFVEAEDETALAELADIIKKYDDAH